MGTIKYMFDFLVFHEHVFFVRRNWKSIYYAEIWRLPNLRQDDDQDVNLWEQRHHQRRCKVAKNYESLHQAEIMARHTSHEKTSKSIVLDHYLVRKIASKKKQKTKNMFS